MNERELLDLCKNLLEHARRAGAHQVEAAAAWQRVFETHVENGAIHTVQSKEEAIYGVRVLVGRSQGFVTANDLEPALLAQRAREAVEQARATPVDLAVGLARPERVEPVPGLFDDEVAGLDSSHTTRLAGEMLARIRELDPRVRVDSGSVSASVAVRALASSTGIVVSEAGTYVDASAFGMAVDGDDVASFDYDSAISRHWRGFNSEVAEACSRFVDKCRAGLGAGRGESFRGPIVLSPEAVTEFLLPPLVAALSADSVRKGKSPLATKLGHTIAATSLDVWDDGRLPGAPSAGAFDREGLPTRRRALVAAGVLQGLLYNQYEANAAGSGARSTGNAVGAASALPGVGPHHLEVDPGAVAMADMVDPAERAIWVGRYSGSTNAVTGDFSGVVKNGYFVSGGERRPVREVLIAGNVFDLLGRISALSRERQEVGGQALVPAIRAEDVSVTAG